MSNITKRLKNKSFNTFSASLGCVFFIIYGLIMDLVSSLFNLYGMNLFLAIVISFLVEAVFFFAAISVCAVQKVELVEATDLNKKISYKTVLLCVLISIITLYCFTNLTSAFVMTLSNFGYKQSVANITIPNFGIYILYVFLLCITPAVFEEMLFRGVILNGLKEHGKHKAVFISALIFMLMHGGPDQTIHQFILGVILGYVFVASGSLLSTIIIHFFNNFSTITLLYLQNGSGYQVKDTIVSKVDWMSILVIFLVGVVAAIIGGYLIKLIISRIETIEKNRKSVKKEQNEGGETQENAIKEEPLVQNPNTLSQIMLNNSKQKSIKTITTICFSASFAYLAVMWILTLVGGFLG